MSLLKKHQMYNELVCVPDYYYNNIFFQIRIIDNVL